MNVETEGVSETITVTPGALDALRKTRFWVQFLGVLSVIVAVVCAIMLLVGIASVSRNLPSSSLLIGEGAFFAVVFILFAVWQLGYSGALRQLFDSGGITDATLERAIVKQRGLWKLAGIVLLISVAMFIAAILFAATWGHQLFAALPPSATG